MTAIGERLDLLDVFRGIAVAGMILVTSPGDWNRAYPLLRHAGWNGWTMADMVFPAFLFAVGIATGLSFPRDLSIPGTRSRLWSRVARRVSLLVLVGLAVNWLYNAAIPGIPVVIGHPGLAYLRMPGVLQRIAFCYAASLALIVAFPNRLPSGRTDVNPRVVAAAIVALLIGYWLALRFVPVPGYGVGRLDQEGNLPAFLDRAIFTPAHMWPLGSVAWAGPVVFDPEGLLSSLPAATNTLFGVLAALVWRRPQATAVRTLGGAGAVLTAAGLLLNPVIPINKPLWTSSFALLSSGISMLIWCLLAMALRSPVLFRALTPLRVLGTNAVLAFVISVILTKFGGAPWFRLNGATVTAQAWGDAVARRIILDEALASTACAVAVVGLIVLILWPLHRRTIRFRL